MKFSDLRGKHHGETAWIVGKGPSLAHLRAEHFGVGPVIGVNQAIAIVEELGLPNPIYSLQKDGCGLVGPHEACQLRDGRDWMIEPQRAVLLVQNTEGYSRDCLVNYEPRVSIDYRKDLKLEFAQTMATRMSVVIAREMGCAEVRLMCCDSLVSGNVETFNIHTRTAERTTAGDHYLPARGRLMRELVNTRYQIFIPTRSEHG